MSKSTRLHTLCWVLFALWLLLQLPPFLHEPYAAGRSVDFLTYRRAADALLRGESPYLGRSESLAIWRDFHANDAAIRTAGSPEQRRALTALLAQGPPQPGPYLYPPTLAALVAALGVQPFAFACLLALAAFGYAWLWIRASGAHPAWLLLVGLSWDVLQLTAGGNVELLLLGVSLLAAWLLWRGRWLGAAPLIALVALIKPFYALLFITFGLLLLARSDQPAARTVRTLAAAATLALVLIGAEALRWDAPLRQAALDNQAGSLDRQWLALPPAEQTPMSAWNRTPLQALIGVGVPTNVAVLLTLLLWAGLTGASMWRARQHGLSFALAWALALVLLYHGRPVGWTLGLLEVTVVAVLWPRLGRAGRAALLAGLVALILSHWAALVLTGLGAGMLLNTLQTPAFPWETLLVLPGCWLLLLWAVGQPPDRAIRPYAARSPARPHRADRPSR
ncbi:MAG TPA: hypothetical protein VFS21_33735 [Roseiflexaceae bacterium]|nr:hypothetical protein [Roseiflexaceae bacterium]